MHSLMQLKWLIGIRTSLNIKLVIVVRVTLALFHRTGLKFQEKQIFFTFKSCKMFVTQAHLYRSKMGFSFFRPFRRIVMWFFTWLLFNSKTAIIPSCMKPFFSLFFVFGCLSFVRYSRRKNSIQMLLLLFVADADI